MNIINKNKGVWVLFVCSFLILSLLQGLRTISQSSKNGLAGVSNSSSVILAQADNGYYGDYYGGYSANEGLDPSPGTSVNDSYGVDTPGYQTQPYSFIPEFNTPSNQAPAYNPSTDVSNSYYDQLNTSNPSIPEYNPATSFYTSDNGYQTVQTNNTYAPLEANPGNPVNLSDSPDTPGYQTQPYSFIPEFNTPSNQAPAYNPSVSSNNANQSYQPTPTNNYQTNTNPAAYYYTSGQGYQTIQDNTYTVGIGSSGNNFVVIPVSVQSQAVLYSTPSLIQVTPMYYNVFVTVDAIKKQTPPPTISNYQPEMIRFRSMLPLADQKIFDTYQSYLNTSAGKKQFRLKLSVAGQKIFDLEFGK